MSSNKLLEGKTIIVTGASTGIGKAISIGLAELGASVALLSRSENKLKKNVETIKKNGGKAIYIPTDVAKYDQIESAFKNVDEKFGQIHVLINNASFAPLLSAINSVEDIDKAIDVDLKGVFYGTFAIIPYFEKIKHGSIINTSSVAGLNRWDGANPIYDACKAAVNRLTTTINLQFKSKQIRINSILPGWVDTPMIKPIMDTPILKSMIEATNVPLLKPAELLPYYVFFASDKSKRVSNKLVNLVYFWKVLDFIKKLPEDQPRTWENISDLVQKNYSYGTFTNIKENRKLLMFLLDYEKIR